MADIDLTGRWTGVYFYPVDPVQNPLDDCPPTPFIAEVTDTAGIVRGTTSEPDVMYDATVHIPSVIEGSHDGSALRFVKFSDAPEGFEEAIHYDGAISKDGLTIQGQWSIPGWWSGTFRMQRQSGAAASREAEAADRMTR
ncbi:MAG: hypothetical protein KKC29_02940 [Alphaproteobacteria bacterium]|jgi:hypothetical protein|nr:hypothetical protein [Alphaproteobacteria bacterium]MBU2041970.1 hypothetical protein [Alphaproteobacteria bacterium]MBU2125124.1 hypothetical protein [Alphaproteobacteria bacterium]MBU2207535.1 hypothetical protein [Alphaproteobacteria bacterium]MBU2290040.1 hypothetical protein [Alphaproteobacteria bacterium]